MAMQLKPIGPNVTELHVGNAVILFSYETPVAARIGGQYYVTSKRYSNTTSRHISKWVGGSGSEVTVVDPGWLTKLTCQR
jgi:hypothetical protein